MIQLVNKKVKLKLVGTDGNAFAVMGNFSAAARRAQWTKEEIDTVLNDAMSDDYNHLLAVISAHCE